MGPTRIYAFVICCRLSRVWVKNVMCEIRALVVNPTCDDEL
jgi:hypothetical protein